MVVGIFQWSTEEEKICVADADITVDGRQKRFLSFVLAEDNEKVDGEDDKDENNGIPANKLNDEIKCSKVEKNTCGQQRKHCQEIFYPFKNFFRFCL